MQNWKKNIIGMAMQLDDQLDKNLHRLRQRLGFIDKIHLVPYRTYGTPQHVYVRGRVLEDKNITTAQKDDNLFSNLLNMYKRFESDEVPGARLQLNFPGSPQQAVSDKEGYFVLSFVPPTPLITEELYFSIPLQIVEAPGSFSDQPVYAEMMIPPPDAEYGIISDIDDTIIRTGATDLLAMGKTVLFGNAKTRLPFAGVSAFYRSLQLGRNGKRNNPFFYVSSSPWNLYDLLIDFMDHNDVPQGPLLLRDFGLQSESFMSGDYMSHKFTEIKRVLDTYPHLNFVLVGDSGEQDPGIYLEVVKQCPGRILAVYIRDVVAGKKHEIAKQVVIDMKEAGVEMVLTEHTVQAAEHAALSGLIFTSEIPAIVTDKKQDEGAVPGKTEAEAV